MPVEIVSGIFGIFHLYPQRPQMALSSALEGHLRALTGCLQAVVNFFEKFWYCNRGFSTGTSHLFLLPRPDRANLTAAWRKNIIVELARVETVDVILEVSCIISRCGNHECKKITAKRRCVKIFGFFVIHLYVCARRRFHYTGLFWAKTPSPT